MRTEKQIAAISAELANDPQVTQGKMFGASGFKLDGKVFAMFVKGKLVIKVPQARAAELVQTGQGEFFDPGHGRRMKEWVAFEHGSKSVWRQWIAEAKAYVAASAGEKR